MARSPHRARRRPPPARRALHGDGDRCPRGDHRTGVHHHRAQRVVTAAVSGATAHLFCGERPGAPGHRIATTPLAQAEALVNWFRSGMFRYTLTPPALSPGTDALVGFLTDTLGGTCEAFAGAFAVMARSLGLPTRVAVGFTGGRSSPGGTMTVRGADAHEWPEVYLEDRVGMGVVRADPATPPLASCLRRVWLALPAFNCRPRSPPWGPRCLSPCPQTPPAVRPAQFGDVAEWDPVHVPYLGDHRRLGGCGGVGARGRGCPGRHGDRVPRGEKTSGAAPAVAPNE